MTFTLILSATALVITSLLCATALRAWRGWLELRRAELEMSRSGELKGEIGVRIELADVRERLKKLEAIASGVEL
jgi:hypothetical protein